MKIRWDILEHKVVVLGAVLSGIMFLVNSYNNDMKEIKTHLIKLDDGINNVGSKEAELRAINYLEYLTGTATDEMRDYIIRKNSLTLREMVLQNAVGVRVLSEKIGEIDGRVKKLENKRRK